MNIDKNARFMTFLESLKNSENIDLIESIQNGYNIILENNMDSLINKMQSKVDRDKKNVPKPDPSTYITDQQMRSLESYLDTLFEKIGIDVGFTTHFKERVNDARNKKQITIDELREIFEDTYATHGIDLSHHDDLEAVITDLDTDLNVPFVLVYDPRSNMLKLKAKTVMRKHDFLTPDPKYYV